MGSPGQGIALNVSAVPPREAESVMIVMDGNRDKHNVDAMDWALKHVVRRGDSVIAIGVIGGFGMKNTCFPFYMGMGFSGIRERLEFSTSRQEVRPKELGEEIERKKQHYQNNLKPFYRKCKKNEVNLEIKLTFGCCPLKITVEQARKSNPRWIVLDSNWKKYKTIIYSKVGCSIAVMKGKDLATLIPSRNGQTGISTVVSCRNRSELDVTDDGESSSSSASRHSSESARESSGWYPLSWRSGFPRAFSLTDLEVMTNGFSKDNIVPHGPDDIRIYEGVFQQTPILIRSFVENDERFWTALTILSRIRHKNIMNLVGYCCYENSTFLLFDNPCMGSLEINLRVDDMARKLSWKTRWNIALETGGSLQYLHEECATDGAIVHLSVCSSHVSLCYGSITMLAYFATARFLKDERASNNDCQTQMGRNEEHDELIAVDIHDYGVLLIELVSGMSARLFQRQGVGQSLVDWAMPLLENGSIDAVLDPRVEEEMNDSGMIQNLIDAALICLNSNGESAGHQLSMSQVLAMVRGGKLP